MVRAESSTSKSLSTALHLLTVSAATLAENGSPVRALRFSVVKNVLNLVSCLMDIRSRGSAAKPLWVLGLYCGEKKSIVARLFAQRATIEGKSIDP